MKLYTIACAAAFLLPETALHANPIDYKIDIIYVDDYLQTSISNSAGTTYNNTFDFGQSGIFDVTSDVRSGLNTLEFSLYNTDAGFLTVLSFRKTALLFSRPHVGPGTLRLAAVTATLTKWAMS